MSKILSQWEIDALLNSVGGEEAAPSGPVHTATTEQRPVKLYDFRRPDKFSKDHIRAIQNVHETFARLTSSSLTSYLRAGTQVHLTSVEQVVYDEYIQQLASPTVVNLVEMQPLAGRIVVEMNMNISLAMLDRMMGGTGRAGARRGELTDIELALIRSLSSTVVGGLREAWSMAVDLQPVLADTVLSAEFVQAALPGDIAALLLLEVQTLGVSGMLSICIPHPVIEPIMDKLSTQLWLSSSRKADALDDRQKLEHRMRDVQLPIAVELGGTSISVRELISLQEGDVIRLDRASEADLTILVGDQPRFLGRPGILSGNRAIQVTGAIRQPDDDDGFEAA